SLIHIQSQNYGEALRDCNTAINLDRSHAKAFNNRGLAYLKLGYLDRAIEDFSEALRLDPRLPEALLNRGVAYNAQGEFAPALKDFEHADLLSDAQPDLWLGWGNALLGVGDYPQAIARLSQAVLCDPDSAAAHAKRGFAYLQLGRPYFRQARTDLERSLGIYVEPAALSNLGLLERQENNYDRAVEYFERALKLNPGLCVTRFNLALVYLQREQPEEAKTELEQVLKTAPPDSPEAVQARIVLDNLSRQADTSQPNPGEGP
ncbi:MAG: tetratricopeptide repeat protein, partial [Pseudomonadota bacterium]|nr:tetratricopeptide repeat protein [Pseudomonadota bacterium]